MSSLSYRSGDLVTLEMGLLLSVQGSLQALGAHTDAPRIFSSTSSGSTWLSHSTALCKLIFKAEFTLRVI